MRFVPWFFFLSFGLISSPAVAQSHSVPLPREGSSGGDSSGGGSSSGGSSGSTGSGSTENNSTSKKKDPRSGKKKLDPNKKRRSNSGDSKSGSNDSGDYDSGDSDSEDYSDDSGEDGSYRAAESTFDARMYFSIGGHLTLAGTELQKTSNQWGGGPDLLIAIGPKNFPLLFGAQLGFDWFGSRTERFTFDGELNDWDIDRRAIWTHALVRWMPLSGMIRPHVDLLGGVWFHDVTIDEDLAVDDEDEVHTVGSSATGSYGFGLGVDFATESGFLFGLSAVHLRGGSIKVPDVKSVAIVDEVLYYDDVTARGIHQWMFLFNIGGVSR